jgi:hypothetical protein
MNLLSDIITYVRRIIKSPSDAVISDELIIDYINRFWMMDVDARIQLFDLKTTYQFQTQPGVDQYNMPLYSVQTQPTGSNQTVAMYPVYQGFVGPAYVNGIPITFQTQKNNFFNGWINVVQQMQAIGTGNGTAGPYTLNFTLAPDNSTPLNPPLQAILRGHVDITGVIATGNNVDPPTGITLNTNIPSTSIYPQVYITSTANDGSNIVVQDSGQFLAGNVQYGLLMAPGAAPFGYSALTNGYSNAFPITNISQASQALITTSSNFQPGQQIQIGGVVGMTEINGLTVTVVSVTPTDVTVNLDTTGFTAYASGGTASSLTNVFNYFTGIATNVFFPAPIPEGANISAQCFFYQSGLPRGVLFYNNTLTFRTVPDRQYLVELDAYLSPSAFLSDENAIPFGYMAEYIARGAARKILSDTGDVEQFQFYEPLFREQEMLVWKRSQRQWTATRTQTLYSQGLALSQNGSNSSNGTIF